MPKTITIELSDEEEAAARDATQPYRNFISKNPALLSLLYDIDLLPEQIVLAVNANRMIVVCRLFKQLSLEQLATMYNNKTDDI